MIDKQKTLRKRGGQKISKTHSRQLWNPCQCCSGDIVSIFDKGTDGDHEHQKILADFLKNRVPKLELLNGPLPGWMDAEDLLQKISIELWKLSKEREGCEKREKGHVKKYNIGYLKSIEWSKFKDLRRRFGKECNSTIYLSDKDNEESYLGVNGIVNPAQEEECKFNILISKLKKALTPAELDVLNLRMEGFSFKRVAEMLGFNNGKAVERMMPNIKKTIKKMFENNKIEKKIK